MKPSTREWLHKRCRDTLACLVAAEANGERLSYRRISQRLGLRDHYNTVHRHITRLASIGFVTVEPGAHKSIRVTDDGRGMNRT
jgi:Mn-dependent DtxR family transcriptional regulator